MSISLATSTSDYEFPKRQVLDLLARKDVHEVLVTASVGSKAHNTSTGPSDEDFCVIRFESWHEFVNGPGDRQSMQIRSKPEGERSETGDIDLAVYTLRKFAHLALQGNPSILTVLWTPETYMEGDEWPHLAKELKQYLPARSAGKAFLGYMTQQMERWRGVRGQRNVTRPELVEMFGYDTKYAAQIIRLGYQGIHYMKEGEIPVPIPEDTAAQIRDLRSGGMPEQQAMKWANDLDIQLRYAISRSLLPETPNYVAVQHQIASTYGVHYAPDLRNS